MLLHSLCRGCKVILCSYEINEDIKLQGDLDGKPHTSLSSEYLLMSRGQGSIAKMVLRRSIRANQGLNGHNTQLNHLDEQLTAPTCSKKRPFVPKDRLVLEGLSSPCFPTPSLSRVQSPHLPAPSLSHMSQNPPPSPHLPLHRLNAPQPPSRLWTSSPLCFQTALPPLPDVIKFNDLDANKEAELEELEVDEDAGLEDLDINEEVEPEDLEVDEQSEDEDDCRTHAFLRSSNQLTAVPVPQLPTPTVQVVPATALPQPPHVIQDFAVSSKLFCLVSLLGAFMSPVP